MAETTCGLTHIALVFKAAGRLDHIYNYSPSIAMSDSRRSPTTGAISTYAHASRYIAHASYAASAIKTVTLGVRFATRLAA